MKTENKNLLTFIEELDLRNKKIQEEKKINEINKKYFQELNSMGVLVLNG